MIYLMMFLNFLRQAINSLLNVPEEPGVFEPKPLVQDNERSTYNAEDDYP